MTKYYTKELQMEYGEYKTVYKESDIGEWYAEAMKKIAELDNELELDRDGEEVKETICPKCKEKGNGATHCTHKLEGHPNYELNADPESREYVPTEPTHPYKVEPNVLDQIKHLNRRIGNLESRLGSKREEAKEPNLFQSCQEMHDKYSDPAKEIIDSVGKNIKGPTEPAYDLEYWKEWGDVNLMTYHTSYKNRKRRNEITREYDYQKTLERIKHDLKIGGGE